ncbi:response regulator [Occallatibacter savannae]|uniref:response regulator n=1 Tax=Occallatibacter savannae TaxID=1002691 RepID=UPI000D686B3C|nr:response regulator [Occallatibacter savannae]
MSEAKVSRLLILDDEKVLVDILCRIVNECGYEARGAYDHDTAMAIAREFEPDFFLTGFCNSCDKNGCESIAELETFLPQCRNVLFSGTASAAPFIEEYFRRGYEFQVFAKPLHPQDFLNWMRSHGATARAVAKKAVPDQQQSAEKSGESGTDSEREMVKKKSRFSFLSRKNK